MRGGDGWPARGNVRKPLRQLLFTHSSWIASTARFQTLRQSSREPSRLSGVKRVPRSGRLAAFGSRSRHLHEDGVAYADAPSSTSGSITARLTDFRHRPASSRIRLVASAALASQTALSSKSRLTELCRQPGARASRLDKEKGRSHGPALRRFRSRERRRRQSLPRRSSGPYIGIRAMLVLK